MPTVMAAMMVVMTVAGFDDHHLVDVRDRRQSRNLRDSRRGGVRVGGREPDQTDSRQTKGQKGFHWIEGVAER